MSPLNILLLFFFPLIAQNNNIFNYLPNKVGSNIVEHSHYTLGYNEEHEQASWVAYRLTGHLIQNPLTKQKDDFRSDPKVKTGSATLSDYKGSGYDRGHLAPAADFKWSATAMSESFYMSNMSPQVPGFNRGIWKNMESTVRNWAVENDEIYIVTGPVLGNTLGSIGSNRVSIPSQYYKVILDYKEPDTKGIGIIMPNEKSDASLSFYAVSIDEVERVTGIDFFPELPDKIEKRIESNINVTNWSWGKSKSYTTNKKSIYKKEVVTNDSERLPAGASIQCSGSTKKGTRCKKKTLNADGYCNLHRHQKK